ncbi:MAG: D-tyrosyl-tRNA(Tyr) deacylase [Acidobacteria bacterium]|nr:D-tyrosyl-tRNA(Tyr) deacylase [Acidobacteriota bacterium]MBK8150108.1 D-tyrosyl-tRNA(Tyr) deacylase [Acidobacteriota bacterium]MBK8811070.1 D-tyrosyl-tRNA(Tyr) deacylase [Acidobacteriota bacterium]
MRCVVQRVSRARVTVDGEVTGEIGRGLLVLLGVSRDDSEAEALFLVDKTLNLRIFEDDEDRMNLSLLEVGGELLVVSQFTLYGDARKGRRPSFIAAAAPDDANRLYEFFVAEARKQVIKVETGRFQAMMDVELVNDGPVTILLDSDRQF